MQFSKSFCLKNSKKKKWCGFVCRFAFFLLGYCYLLGLSVFWSASCTHWSCSHPPESEKCGAYLRVFTPAHPPSSLGLGRTVPLEGTQTGGFRRERPPGTAVSLLSARAGVLMLAAHSQDCHGNTDNTQVQTVPLRVFIFGSGGSFLRRGSNC